MLINLGAISFLLLLGLNVSPKHFGSSDTLVFGEIKIQNSNFSFVTIFYLRHDNHEWTNGQNLIFCFLLACDESKANIFRNQRGVKKGQETLKEQFDKLGNFGKLDLHKMVSKFELMVRRNRGKM